MRESGAPVFAHALLSALPFVVILDLSMFSNVYLNNIAVACITFPLVAALITLPYLVVQYRRFGSVPWWRTFVVYLFVLYLMAAYFLVILPLPTQDVYVPYAAHPQLVPFSFVGEIAHDAHVTSDPATWLAALTTPAVYQVLFNVLLTIPFGFFLRYYFHRSWWQVLILGFLWTLFFETSQFTGLFGIYQHPYRLFDVDDLITNTTGSMVGFWLALLFARVLPDMDEVNQEAWEKGSRASLTRRIVSFVVDMLIASLAAALVGSAWKAAGLNGAVEHQAIETAIFAVCFALIPALPGSATLGQRLLRLRIVATDGSKAPWWRRALRYLVLYLLLVAAPATLIPALPSAMLASEKWVDPALLVAVLMVFFIIWVISVIVRAVRSAMGHPFVMVNGLITGTRIAPSPRADHKLTSWRERLAEKRAAAAAKRGEHAQSADDSEDAVEEGER